MVGVLEMIDKTYKDSKTIIRDLCFAIWHDDILSDNPIHHHHGF